MASFFTIWSQRFASLSKLHSFLATRIGLTVDDDLETPNLGGERGQASIRRKNLLRRLNGSEFCIRCPGLFSCQCNYARSKSAFTAKYIEEKSILIDC